MPFFENTLLYSWRNDGRVIVFRLSIGFQISGPLPRAPVLLFCNLRRQGYFPGLGYVYGYVIPRRRRGQGGWRPSRLYSPRRFLSACSVTDHMLVM